MSIPFHPHRSTRFSFAEHRMLFDVSSPEVMQAMEIIQTEKKDATPEDRNDTAKQLDDLVAKLDPKAQEAFFVELGQKVNTLPQIEQEQINANLQALAERNAPPAGAPIAPENAPVDGTRSAVERLRQKIQVPAEKPAEAPVAAAEEPAEAAPADAKQTEKSEAIVLPPLRIRSNNEAPAGPEKPSEPTTLEKLNPLNWSPETQKKALIGGGVAVLTGAVIAAGLSIWNWVKGTTEKVKAGFTWTEKTALIAGAVGIASIAGFIGLNKIQEMTKQYASAQKGLRDGLAIATASAGTAMAAAETATKAAEELARNPQPILAAAADLGKKKVNEVAAKPEVKAAKEVGKDVAKEAIEVGGESLVSNYLIAFENHPDIKWPEGTKAEDHKDKIDGILFDFAHRPNFAMKDIFECMRFGSIDRKAVEKLYPKPSGSDEKAYEAYLAATELVVRSCLKRRQEVEKGAGKDASDMPFKEFMGRTAGSAEAATAVQKQIKEHGFMDIAKWDWTEVARSLEKENRANNDLTSLLRSHPRFDEITQRRNISPQQFELGLGNLEQTTKLLTTLEIPVGGDVSQVRTKVEAVNLDDPNLSVDQVLGCMLVQQMLATMPSPAELQPFFNTIFPKGEDWVEAKNGEQISPENEKVIQGYINGMAFTTAVRFMFYKRMMQRENALGMVLSQAEMLKFIREKEEGWFEVGDVELVKTRAWLSTKRLASRLAEGDYSAEMQKIYGASEKMIAQVDHAIRSAAPILEKEGIEWVVGGVLSPVEMALAAAQDNPIPTTIIGVLGTTGASYYAYSRLYSMWQSRRGLGLEEYLKKVGEGKNAFRNGPGHLLKLTIHSKDFALAHSWVEHTLGGVAKLKGDQLLHAKIDTAVREAIGNLKSGGTEEALTKLRDLLKAEAASLAAADPTRATLLEKMAAETDDFLAPHLTQSRRALEIASHPIRTRIRTFGLPVLGQALGLYMGVKNIKAGFEYGNLAERARNENLSELADIYDELRTVKKVEGAGDILTGAGLYYLPLRGFVALEVARFAAVNGLESIKEDVEGVTITDKQARELPLAELEKNILQYAPDEGSWGQAYRSGIILSTLSGDTRESLLRESELIRNNYFRGLVTRRLLESAGRGEVFAMMTAQPMFDEEGRERKGADSTINKYISYVQSDLERQFGTRNDLSIMQKGGKFDSALETANLSASLRLQVDGCLGLMEQSARLQEEAPSVVKELEKIDVMYALSGDKTETARLLQRRNELRTQNAGYIKQANAISAGLERYDDIRLKMADGRELSILDIAKKQHQERGQYSMKAEDAVPYLAAYRGWVRTVEEEYEKELLDRAKESIRKNFGTHAERVLRMSPAELLKVRQEHAEVLVDIHYLTHSKLAGLKFSQKRGFAIDQKEATVLLQDRLNALNEYMRAHLHQPMLIIEPAGHGGMVSPKEAFLKAGNYEVNETGVAFHNSEDTLRMYHESGYNYRADDVNAASESSRWHLEKAVRRYRKLLDEFES